MTDGVLLHLDSQVKGSVYFYEYKVENILLGAIFSYNTVHVLGGRDNSVGTATCSGLDGPGIPVGERFSAPVQTGPEAHPASCTMGTGSFPGVKRPRRGFEHPTPPIAEVEGRVQLNICSPSGSSWPVIG